MTIRSAVLGTSLGYSLWSSMFDPSKMTAMKNVLPKLDGLRVLDVGCGPATNTKIFESCDYTGIDINERYIQTAQAKYPSLKFMVQDASRLTLPQHSFDLVIINSMIHHLNDQEAKALFNHLKLFLKKEGRIIISEPLKVNPDRRFKHFMMTMDRGGFFRSFEQYEKLFCEGFSVDQEFRYSLKAFSLWPQVADMIVLRLHLT